MGVTLIYLGMLWRLQIQWDTIADIINEAFIWQTLTSYVWHPVYRIEYNKSFHQIKNLSSKQTICSYAIAFTRILYYYHLLLTAWSV